MINNREGRSRGSPAEKDGNEKTVRKEIYRLIIPMILENLLQVSAGLISTAMIGRLMASDISAQGICVRITDTLWCFYKGVAIGATVLIARSFGAGKRDKCRRVAEQTLLTEIPIALLLGVALFFVGMPVFRFFTEDAGILVKAGEYMRIIVFGFPFVVIMSVVTATFQGHGNTRTPMYIAVAVNIINIIFGYLLIFGPGLLPEFGIRGAAMALVSSQAGGACIGLYLLHRKGGLLRNTEEQKHHLRPDGRLIKEIYRTGVPAALESMFWQFSAIILSKVILAYGENSFAAYQLGIQAETVTEMPAIGFSTASTTLAARALGQKDYELKETYFNQLIRIALRISICTSLLLIVLPKAFMGLMTNNSKLQAIGAVYVFIMGFVQIPQNLSRIYNGTIRASGYPGVPMYIAGFGIWIVRIPLSIIAAYVLKWSILSIWLIIALDQISRFLLSVAVYHHTKKKAGLRERMM